MRQILWTDKDGYKHLSLVRDSDSDDAAPFGILCDPPDLRLLNWDAIVKELQNRLTERGLSDWKAVQASQNGVSNVIVSVLKKHVIALYRNSEVKNA